MPELVDPPIEGDPTVTNVKIKAVRKPVQIVFYQDIAGEWRWSLEARNGQIVADSGEGYRTKWGCKRAAKKFLGF